MVSRARARWSEGKGGWASPWCLALALAACGGSPEPAPDAGAPAACDAGPPPGPSDPTRPRRTEAREACEASSPLRNLYWGDLHVHTALSFDAVATGNELGPEDAYRFARGEELEVGSPGARRRVRLARPLDFVAVTDHAELLGETEACLTPGSPGYDSPDCVTFREGGAPGYTALAIPLAGLPPRRRAAVCGPGAADCVARAESLWERLQAAAEAAYDRTSRCAFTSFVAYEYSATPVGSMLHRNIVFRNERVPARPVSAFDVTNELELFRTLRAQCTDACTGCEVLSIAHNPNLSSGRYFQPDCYRALPADEGRALASLTGEMEPLVEIMQHKGSSECRPDLGFGAPDELCDFELVRQGILAMTTGGELPLCNGDGSGTGTFCIGRTDAVRPALTTGLDVFASLGVYPFPRGFVGATDTHNATPGLVDEASFRGHTGSLEEAPLSVLENSPGGLTGVWAVENSRDALFEALSRHETYATSGPRMTLRVFGGRGFDAGLCADPALVSRGYAEGVPMGGTLAAGPGAPSFVVSALRDADGARLARVQLVKAWREADGSLHEAVFEVAGDPALEVVVDTATCALPDAGFDSLCGVWTDPDFDPSEPAYYYARVLEVPTCRWSTYQCNALPEAERPPECADGSVPRVLEERAWSSPIWQLPTTP